MEAQESDVESFQPAQYTFQRSYGGLKYATVDMFNTFREVENVIDAHLKSPDHIFVRDSYEKALSEISQLKLIPISCHAHPDTLSYLVMEYVQIRFHCEARRYQNLHLLKLQATILGHKK